MMRFKKNVQSLVLSIYLLSGYQATFGIGNITRINVKPDGQQSNEGFEYITTGCLSGNGRFVVFESTANDLVKGDTNRVRDVFVRDIKSNKTERVSVDSLGKQANGDSFSAAISANGLYVVFVSDASNLVKNDTNKRRDIFIYDRSTRKVDRILGLNGKQGVGTSAGGTVSISANGQFIAFSSDDNKLVPNDTNKLADVFLYDRRSKKITQVSIESDYPSMSADGRFIAFYSELSGLDTASIGYGGGYLYDRIKRTTKWISFEEYGVASLSANGQYIAFMSSLAHDITVYDTKLEKIAFYIFFPGQHSPSPLPGLSADGKTLVFSSWRSNLVPNDTNDAEDVFIYNIAKKITRRVSVNSTNKQANDSSFRSVISADGRFVVFQSYASNMVKDDTNDKPDIFIKELR